MLICVRHTVLHVKGTVGGSCIKRDTKRGCSVRCFPGGTGRGQLDAYLCDSCHISLLGLAASLQLPLNVRVWFTAGFEGSKREQRNPVSPPRLCVTAQGQAQSLRPFTSPWCKPAQETHRQDPVCEAFVSFATLQPEAWCWNSLQAACAPRAVWSPKEAPELGSDLPAWEQLPVTLHLNVELGLLQTCRWTLSTLMNNNRAEIVCLSVSSALWWLLSFHCLLFIFLCLSLH